jgi:nicotinate-nucleotide--dimethylbenzimidazole phosphoribosyltransferase
MEELKEAIERIAPVDPRWVARAEARQLRLTKPPGSLGRLERLAARLCAVQQTLQPRSAGRRVIIFAADHGVVREGVSAYQPEVTRQMVANFCAGGAAINAIARTSNAEIEVVDIGIAGDVVAGGQEISVSGPAETPHGVRLIGARVRGGTGNIAREAAMTEDEMLAALRVGIELGQRAAREGVALVGLGEMGIGNTTAASAVTAALTGLAPAVVTGRGTGADGKTLARKVAAVERALETNRPVSTDALDVLRKVGGLEIAGLCGLCLGAAGGRAAIIADGFIATAGAALAVRLCPAVAGYTFAGHLSTEPGHAALLELVGLRQILDLEMRLGEGTGAALAMNIIGAAVAAFNEMATFDSAGVSDKSTEANSEVLMRVSPADVLGGV